MKNTLLITACILILTACTTTPVKTPEKPVVSSEVITNIPTTPAKTPAKTIPVKTPEKVAPNTTRSEATADDLTKELDSLIDAIVSSK